MSGSPVVSRVDSIVDFSWPGLITPTGADYVSVRWSGFLLANFNEKYTFSVLVDDGARLTVNGQVVIDQLDYQSVSDTATTFEGTTVEPLIAGHLYRITLEYRENQGNARVQLNYSSVSEPNSVIPTSHLFSGVESISHSPFDVRVVPIKAIPPDSILLDVLSESSLQIRFSRSLNDGGDAVDRYFLEWFSAPGQDEIQEIITEGVTSGTFLLAFGDAFTQPIPHDATAEYVEYALESIPAIGKVDVTRSGPIADGYMWLVTFLSNVGDLPAMSADGSSLFGPTLPEVGICTNGSTGATTAPGTSIDCRGNSQSGSSPIDYCGGDSGGICPELSDFDPLYPPTEFVYNITGLNPGVLITARISAINDAGFGPISSTVQATPVAGPMAPISPTLHLISGSKNSLRVRFGPPLSTNGAPITHYVIEWDFVPEFISLAKKISVEQVASVTPLEPMHNIATNLVYDIVNLTPGQIVYVRVAADRKSVV